ncbi:ER membrane protein complex subunit 10 [Homalodisca vitripennis]|nr:ER membrane protein complex subunit 10 [Homalodisca vitripennis]
MKLSFLIDGINIVNDCFCETYHSFQNNLFIKKYFKYGSSNVLLDINLFKIIIFSYRPDTAAYIQKLEREREARERGDVKDNRSFLAKYWIYIVPVVIFAVLSGASTPEAGGGR